MPQTSISKKIFATAESQTVPRSTVTVTVEEKSVVANATVRIVTIAQASQISRKTLIHNQKRRPRWNDLFIFFI
jgi:hypothetical protein